MLSRAKLRACPSEDLHGSDPQVRMQFDEQGLCDLRGDEIHFGLRLDCLIVRMNDHFDVVICGSERKRVRSLRGDGGRRQKRSNTRAAVNR